MMTETATYYWPFSLYPIVGSYQRETVNSTLIERSFTGIEQRMGAYPTPGYSRFNLVTVPIKPNTYLNPPETSLSTSTNDPAKDFYYFLDTITRGRLNTFYFYPYDFEYWNAVPLVTLAGGESGFTMPYRVLDEYCNQNGASSGGLGLPSVKIAGVSQVFGTDYSAFQGRLSTPGPGYEGSITASSTLLTFTGGADAGALTASFFGSKRMICRLDTDNPPRQIFAPASQPLYVQWSLSFLEVR